MKKCVFFDRDGIVNKSPGPGRYVESLAGFQILPDFIAVLKEVTDRGYSAVVVTNQRCVARGIVSLDVVESIHAYLREVLEKEYDLKLMDIMCCPHDRDEGCECRKPRPGMLLEAAEKFDIDIESSWMIGDHETDVQAGKGAGCRTIRVLYGDTETAADYSVDDMAELKTRIIDILQSVN